MTNRTQLRQMGAFDTRVPRYTSYPAANHFSSTVGPRQLSGWLGGVAPGSAISLYIHVPFCRRLCWFCACRTQGTTTAAPVAAYLGTLKREIAMAAKALPPDTRLARMHWGGGTPTILEAPNMADLADWVARHFPFAEGAEFSVEIDPNEIDEPRLDALGAAGMTRASIGVQDFNGRIQQAIGRPQSFETTRAAVHGLRARGIDSLNIDMVYGLPHQTQASLSESIQRVLSLGPDRVALYGYAHVPWMARRQAMIPDAALPDAEARIDLFDTAERLFLWDGFGRIGIDHFARHGDSLARAAATGNLRRNFQGYTDDTSEVLFGIGASAISKLPGGYAQNASATSEYRKRIEAGAFATARGHELTHDDRTRGAIIEALMCGFAVDPAALAQQTGLPLDRLKARLSGLGAAFPGMVRETAGGGVRITRKGRPLTRIIASRLDAYASTGPAHSLAV